MGWTPPCKARAAPGDTAPHPAAPAGHLEAVLSLWAFPNATRAASPCQVTGVVSDADGKAHYVMSGTWDEKMECSKIVHSSHGSTSTEGKQKTVYQTLSPKVLWRKYPLP